MTQQLNLAANVTTELFGHLQIVYEDSDGNLVENETTSPGFPYFFGDWAFPEFGRPHDNESNTPGYGDPNEYAIVPLELRPEQEPEYVWELMGQINASLRNGDHSLDYDIEQNSNSYITSVLWVVGIDITAYLDAVTPPDVQSFPGVDTNIFQGAKTGGLFSDYDTPIPLTLAGTDGNDYIRTGIGDDDLGGAAGNDTIYAGAGNDLLKGDAGADLLFGEAGDDRLRGGGGNDDLKGGSDGDLLFGGAGNDVLRGNYGNDLLNGGGRNDKILGGFGNDRLSGGAGNDQLRGDAGSDVFVFQLGDEGDTILDFGGSEGDIIELSLFENPALYFAKDNAVQMGEDVVIDFGTGDVLTLAGVRIEDLGLDDFMIV